MPDYKKYYIIPEEPSIVYQALVNPLTLSLWTGFPAYMSEEVGDEFSLWDGNIVGRNLAFEAGKMIKQEWYFGEREEESIVTIKLHPHKKGSSVELQHTNIPEEDFEAMVEGWDNTYFADLIEFYAGE
jgi:activator of HSP90 ATPase